MHEDFYISNSVIENQKNKDDDTFLWVILFVGVPLAFFMLWYEC
jgi:hypothetical protein